MSDSLTIALDTMGGDHAPAVVLRGADIALMRYPAARFLLFGDEARVAPLLAKLPRLAKKSAWSEIPRRSAKSACQHSLEVRRDCWART